MKNIISSFGWEFLRASRTTGRHLRFFIITVVVLSLGIGMSTALFSIMYGVLLKPLPVRQQDRLVVGWKSVLTPSSCTR